MVIRLSKGAAARGVGIRSLLVLLALTGAASAQDAPRRFGMTPAGNAADAAPTPAAAPAQQTTQAVPARRFGQTAAAAPVTDAAVQADASVRRFGSGGAVAIKQAALPVAPPNNVAAFAPAPAAPSPSRQFGAAPVAKVAAIPAAPARAPAPARTIDSSYAFAMPARNLNGVAYVYQGHSLPPFHVAPYQWPAGLNYVPMAPGGVLPRQFWLARYFIGNARAFELAEPAAGEQWLRYGPDLLRISLQDGEVRETVPGAFEEADDVQDGSLNENQGRIMTKAGNL